LGTAIAHFRLSRLEDSVARTLAESAGLVVKRAEAALILAFSPREKEETSGANQGAFDAYNLARASIMR